MPTNRRRRTYERTADLEELTKNQRYQLLHGRGFFGNELDEEAFRWAWEVHGAQLSAEYLQTHPGRRAFGWWFCEHCQERPIVDTGKFATGFLVAYRREADTYMYSFLHTDLYPPLQQPEFEYLDERGLIGADERERSNELAAENHRQAEEWKRVHGRR